MGIFFNKNKIHFQFEISLYTRKALDAVVYYDGKEIVRQTLYTHYVKQFYDVGTKEIVNNTVYVEKQTSSIWHILGCMPTKSSDDVKKAFKRMSLVYHPDVGGSTKAFQMLQEAKDKALSQCDK